MSCNHRKGGAEIKEYGPMFPFHQVDSARISELFSLLYKYRPDLLHLQTANGGRGTGDATS